MKKDLIWAEDVLVKKGELGLITRNDSSIALQLCSGILSGNY